MDHLKARLDRDQYDAIKHAFSRKVTLKQGPSGTAKKFACKNIVGMLLKNYHHHKRPILLMCFKNETLDTFY